MATRSRAAAVVLLLAAASLGTMVPGRAQSGSQLAISRCSTRPYGNGQVELSIDFTNRSQKVAQAIDFAVQRDGGLGEVRDLGTFSRGVLIQRNWVFARDVCPATDSRPAKSSGSSIATPRPGPTPTRRTRETNDAQIHRVRAFVALAPRRERDPGVCRRRGKQQISSSERPPQPRSISRSAITTRKRLTRAQFASVKCNAARASIALGTDGITATIRPLPRFASGTTTSSANTRHSSALEALHGQARLAQMRASNTPGPPPSGTITSLHRHRTEHAALGTQPRCDADGSARPRCAPARSHRREWRTRLQTVGDAFCAAFDKPEAAASAAIAAQRLLRATDFSAIGGLRVRMAINTGTADERDGDYFGPPVNRVARLLSIGHGGQICSPASPPRSSVRTCRTKPQSLPSGSTRSKISGAWRR